MIFLLSSREVNAMLAELRAKSQVTIPKELVTKLGIKEGDKLEITEKDGVIQLIPVVVYPKKLVEELREEIRDVKTKIASGTQPVFDSIDSLMDELES
jgi:AbrB family looped-hinge helix DNA binding protein